MAPVLSPIMFVIPQVSKSNYLTITRVRSVRIHDFRLHARMPVVYSPRMCVVSCVVVVVVVVGGGGGGGGVGNGGGGVCAGVPADSKRGRVFVGCARGWGAQCGYHFFFFSSPFIRRLRLQQC